MIDPKLEWVEVLVKIQQHYPEAVIAGGALRDLQSGVPVKDLDIFVQYDDDLYDNLVELFSLKEDKIINLDKLSEDQYETLECVLGGIYTMDGVLSIPVQVIGIQKFTSATKQLDKFDIDLCKLAHDGVEWTIGDKYHSDVHAKTMTIGISDELFEKFDTKYINSAMKHAQRLLAKYPDYQIRFERIFYETKW